MANQAAYIAAVKLVQHACDQNGIELKVGGGSSVYIDGQSSLGYFCSEKKILAVAGAVHPFSGVSTLLHEYAHLKQWLEFKAKRKTRGAFLWGALLKARVGSKAEAMYQLQLELDAERRTVKLLRSLNIGTKRDLEAYIKSAALYVWSHHVLHDKKSWFKRSISLPAEVRKWWGYLPSTLRGTFLKPPPKELYNAIASWLT